MTDRKPRSTRTVAPAELLHELESRLTSPQPTPRRGLKRRRRFGAIGALAGATLLALGLVIPALAVHDNQFQLDGNTTVDPPGSGAFSSAIYDWQSIFNDPALNSVGGAGSPTVTLPANFEAADFVEDWGLTGAGAFDTSDPTTFTQSKDNEDVSDWRCVGANNVTDKGDITNAYAALYDDGDERILYFGMEKTQDNGDNNVGLWLLQDPDVGCVGGTGGNGNAFSGSHVDGDLFVVSEFTNGGGVSLVNVYEWVGTGLVLLDTGVDCLDTDSDETGGVPDADPETDRVCATTNLVDIDPQWDHFSKDNGVNGNMEPASFLEGGINLDAFPEFAENCFTGFLFNTRSSQELTATLYDYALGDINTCQPNLVLNKEPENQTHNVGTSFDFTIADASTKPTYSIGLGATLGGWNAIDRSTLTIGAPPNTSGIT
jgi:hypothetical protein